MTFYRQSDIPQIPELTWLLTCVTAKGLMNRAHAYKAAVDANVAQGEDPDAAITMGLYSYPILMAADILMFNAAKVPVGRDQIQHIEMARDVAARFNHLFGNGREFFVLPEALIEEQVATLPGLDGRKMSKSYDNTIPLFEGGARHLKDTIARIVTDSRAPGEPKDPESNALSTLYQAFADAEDTVTYRAALSAGLSWGEAKQRLFQKIDGQIAPLRERYEALIAKPAEIEDILQAGAARARAVAAPLLETLREAVGLRSFTRRVVAGGSGEAVGSDARPPQFKQYRESDGHFSFKLVDGEGRVLLQGGQYASPREAGQRIAALKQGDAAFPAPGENLAEGSDAAVVSAALRRLADD